MIPKKIIKKILCSFIVFISINCYASINSFVIAQDTLAATLKSDSCLHYKPSIQTCLWMSPRVGRNVTPMLDHYLPDLVVIVYRNAGDNPWDEARIFLDSPSANVQTRFINDVGSGDHSFVNEHEKNVIFKEADVIGNPALIIFNEHATQLLLKSTAKPLSPYYQSMLDSALWRGFMPQSLLEETADVALDISHHIGTEMNDWGGLYPHEGTVMGIDDLKASMVVAERATDLLTNPQAFSHIHQSLSNSCGKHCQASPITENSNDTLFQMIYPSLQTECVPLGSDNSYKDSMLNEQGAYMWVVWRHYQGCPDGDGQFLGVI